MQDERETGQVQQAAGRPEQTSSGEGGPKRKMSSLAVAGFILSFFTALIGLALSVVALVRIKKSGERGKGLAVAGICIGLATTLIVAAVAVVATGAINNAVKTNDKAAQLADRAAVYGTAVDAGNAVIDAYNQSNNLSVMAHPTDSQADREKAQANADLIRKIKQDVGAALDKLATEKVFTSDAEAKKKLEATQKAWEADTGALDKIAAGYEALAKGDVDTFNSFVDNQQSYLDTDQAFGKTITDLGSYLVGKQNTLGNEVNSLQKK